MADLEAMQWAMEVGLSDVNTAIPGTVVSFTPDPPRAVVKAAMPKRLANGDELPAPNVYEVPVAYAAGGGFSHTVPLKPGDGVLLVFSQRSLEGWLSGRDTAPDDPRKFALSDAICIPGLRSQGVTVDPEAAVTAWDGGSLRFEPGGVAALKLTKLTIEGEVEVTGGMKVSADVVAGTVSLRNHVHTGTQPGSGVSGVPQA